MVEHHGIAYHEKELGQLCCDESSKQVVRMLLDECEVAGVRVEIGCSVEDVRQRDGGGFALRTSRGPFTAASLVVASGGLSIPSMGASGFRSEEHTSELQSLLRITYAVFCLTTITDRTTDIT